MASEYKTANSLPLLAANIERGAVWWDELSGSPTQAGAFQGTFRPNGTQTVSRVVWTPSGELVSTAPDYVEMITSRPGVCGAGFEAVWQTSSVTDDNGDPVSVGYDEPSVVASTAVVKDGNGVTTNDVYSLCSVALPDGGLAIAYIVNSTGIVGTYGHAVKVQKWSPDTGWAAADTIAYTTQDNRCALALGADGYVHLFYSIGYEDSLLQVAVWTAPGDSALTDAEFRLASPAALATPIDYSAVAFSLAGGLKVAFTGGQWLLLVGTLQYWSIDGAAFAQVGEIDSSNTIYDTAVATTGGAFLVAYDIGTDVLVKRIGSAGMSLSGQDAVATFTQCAASANGRLLQSLAATATDDGRLWLFMPDPIDTDLAVERGTLVAVSVDDGQSWTDYGRLLAGRTYGPRFLSAVPWRDRVVAFAAHASEGGIVRVDVGGYSAVASMPRITSGKVYEGPSGVSGPRVSWNLDYVPDVAPSVVYTQTLTGAGTVGRSGGAYTASNTAGLVGLVQWSALVTTQNKERAACFDVEVTTGAARLDSEQLVTATTYIAQARVTSTRVSLYDMSSGTEVAGYDYGGGRIEVQLWHKEKSARVFWRFAGEGNDEPRVWAELGSTTNLGAAVAVTANQVRLYGVRSVIIPGDFAFTAYRLSVLGVKSSGAAPVVFGNAGTGLATADAQTFGFLVGRAYNGRSAYVRNGFRVSAVGGPGYMGETWISDQDAEYPLTALAWTADAPSPRTTWRTVNADEVGVAYKFDGMNGAAVKLRSQAFLIVLDGDTSDRVGLQWHDGSGWGSSTTLSRYVSIAMTRVGATLYPTTGTGSGGFFVQEDELAGGWVVDASQNSRRILSNTAGVLGNASGATYRTTTIAFEGDDTEDAGGTWRIAWPRAVYVVRAPTTFDPVGFRLVLGANASDRNPPTGFYDWKLLAGEAYLLGEAHGLDTTEQLTGYSRGFRGENGQRWAEQAAPSERVVTLTWQASADMLDQVQGDAIGAWISSPPSGVANPDFVAFTNGGGAAYSRGEAASTLRALVDRWAASGTPVAYCPFYSRAILGSAGVFGMLAGRQLGSIVGTLDPTWTIDHAGSGEEQRNEVVRLGTLTITELT
jgi:hypothetical protein